MKLFPHSQYQALQKGRMGVGRRRALWSVKGGGWLGARSWLNVTNLIAGLQLSFALLRFAGVLH